jgi:hypothetical protein
MVRAASRNLVAWLLLSVVLSATLERHPAGERLAGERLVGGGAPAALGAAAGTARLEPASGGASAQSEHGFCVACFLAATAVTAPGTAPRAVLTFEAEPLGLPPLVASLSSADLGASSPRGPPRV